MGDNKFTLEDFLSNDSFIDYSLNKSESIILGWDNYLREHPELEECAKEAMEIIRFKNKDLSLLSEIEIVDLKDKIFKSI